MYIRKFRGPTVKEAIAKAKAALGEDAVLLHQRNVEVDGPFGLQRQSLVEITVAVDKPPQPLDLESTPTVPQPVPQRSGSEQSAPPSARSGYEDLRQELAFIRKLLYQQTLAQSSLPEPLASWHAALQECGLPGSLASELLMGIQEELTPTALQRPEPVLAALVQRLSAALPQTTGPLQPGQPGNPLVYLLVGPTGVGKTTTIAKLAAHYSLVKQLPVALITADTYRIGAIGQLRTYSELIQAPLEIAYTPEDLHGHVERHQDKAILFIDTPGRSPSDTEQLEVLRSFVAALPEATLHIALAAGTQLADARHIVREFSVIPPQALLLTKLDETTAFGSVYTLAAEKQIPFAYFTTGQSVPEDIEVASRDGFVKRLLDVALARYRSPDPIGRVQGTPVLDTRKVQSFSSDHIMPGFTHVV